MTTRYAQIETLVHRFKPSHIVEVGVHRALRAVVMCAAALRHRRKVYYTGFDVFETMDSAFHEAALNGKGIATQRDADIRLSKLAACAYPAKLLHVFIVGDTRVTLHGDPVEADFAFIDGDHRVDVIRGDAAAIKAPVLVFDDYYRPGPDGRCPDLQRYGANAVVHELEAAGARVEILPAADLCKHGGLAHLALVERAP